MHLINNAIFIGKVLHELDQVSSTNTFALDLLAKSRPIEGTAIIASNQRKGRGQFGNVWESEAGKNLTISIILYPEFVSPQEQFILNQAISLGILEFANDALQLELRIKWPNDLYYADRKLGGILIENTISKDRIVNSVIGIGLNINQTTFSAEGANATSFTLINGLSYNLKALTNRLFEYIEIRYLQLKRMEFSKIKLDYNKSLYKFEVESYFADANKQIFKGKIIGIEESGKLIVQVNGNPKSFDFKEITYV